jgi:hypothetical protein
MALTKSNYKLPERKKPEISEKRKKELERLKYEEKNIATRGAKGSFVVFHEEGLEDVFVADDL